jgi:formyl-CoA transferase
MRRRATRSPIAVNLKDAEGQEVVRRLVRQADILVENFRPARWRSGDSGTRRSRRQPRLIMVRLSGFGQTGPNKDRPASAPSANRWAACATSPVSRPGPVRVGISIGDSLAAMFGVIGALMAMHHRTKSGRGQVVDVALYEAVFAMMESMLPEYGMGGSCASAAAPRCPASFRPTPILARTASTWSSAPTPIRSSSG